MTNKTKHYSEAPVEAMFCISDDPERWFHSVEEAIEWMAEDLEADALFARRLDPDDAWGDQLETMLPCSLARALRIDVTSIKDWIADRAYDEINEDAHDNVARDSAEACANFAAELEAIGGYFRCSGDIYHVTVKEVRKVWVKMYAPKGTTAKEVEA